MRAAAIDLAAKADAGDEAAKRPPWTKDWISRATIATRCSIRISPDLHTGAAVLITLRVMST